jgi:hypothetical protein
VTVLSLAIRSWLRYVLPLTVVAVIAFVPIFIVALRLNLPADAAATKMTALVGYGFAAIAWIIQLALVGAAAAAVRAVAAGERVSQLSMIGRGVRGLVIGVIPAAVAAAGVFAGGVALFVPAIIALGMLAPIAASRVVGGPLQATIADTLDATRRAAALAIGLAVAIIAVDVAIPIVLHKLIVLPVPPKNPPIALLERARLFARVTGGALAIVSPLVACGAAALYELNRRAAPAASGEAPSSPPPP